MKTGARKMLGRLGAVAAAVAGTACAFPTLAFAAEEGGKSGIGAILPDMVEFIPMIVVFIILAVVLGKFGWPVFNRIVTQRDETITDALEKVEAARVESERILEENKATLAEAKMKAKQIVSDAQKAAETVKASIIEQAQTEADEMIAKAKNAIETEKRTAIHELQSNAADLSVAVAGRLIGEDLSDEEHLKIIERYVAEAGSFNAN